MVVRLSDVTDKRRLSVEEQINETAEHGRCAVQTRIRGLAKEVDRFVPRPLEIIDDAAHQHRLAFARVALDPEQLAVFTIAPLLEVVVVENPTVRVAQQAALIVFDTGLVIAWVGGAQVGEELGILVGPVLEALSAC